MLVMVIMRANVDDDSDAVEQERELRTFAVPRFSKPCRADSAKAVSKVSGADLPDFQVLKHSTLLSRLVRASAFAVGSQ